MQVVLTGQRVKSSFCSIVIECALRLSPKGIMVAF